MAQSEMDGVTPCRWETIFPENRLKVGLELLFQVFQKVGFKSGDEIRSAPPDLAGLPKPLLPHLKNGSNSRGLPKWCPL